MIPAAYQIKKHLPGLAHFGFIFSLGHFHLLFATTLLLISCQHEKSDFHPPAFRLHQGNSVGLNFKNTLSPSVDFNILNYMYYYNGGGAGVADFNQDGLEDLFFTRNELADKLVLNRGALQFEDVTEEAGIRDSKGWSTGVTIVDINNDGWPDIYVGKLGDYLSKKDKNRLYINRGVNENGVPQFEEEAARYGLDLIGFSTQACFFDYDLDGDLDFFQLNHSVHRNGTFGQRKTFESKNHPLAGDRLFRNDNGKYVDVTEAAGIRNSAIGYGLGVVITDINLDGYPDLYIGNDFHENDYLYINQQDGTFLEDLTNQIQHTSRFSMGVEAGDLNRDGFAEIFTLDMHPYDPRIMKRSQGENPYNIFNFKLGYGYNHQYARNNLQLNNRNNTFSEIAPFSGVYATDWSWSTLLMDFDNDGNRDIFVSNGIPKRINDLDYINFTADEDIQWKLKSNDLGADEMSLMEKMPEVKIPNQFFKNRGDLRFDKITSLVSTNIPSYSNGAVYADFDLDGDLDIVVNNIDDYPFLYENQASQEASWIQIVPQGPSKNRQAIGTRLFIFKGKDIWVQENFPVRGFQSTVSGVLHIGLGDIVQPDSMLLIWPDNSFQYLEPALLNRRTTIAWQEGLPTYPFSTFHGRDTSIFTVSNQSGLGLDFKHQENPFIEFNREPLMPHMVSAAGPCLAHADINGDGLEDLFVGSGKWQKSALFIQNPDGKFKQVACPALHRDSLQEDNDALFLDVNNDKHPDLIVASGGNEFRNGEEPQAPRLYLNDGRGGFTKKEGAFAGIYLTASCILPEDLDGDAYVDLFLGARAEPWKYGEIPRSYLLKNDGLGNFTDVTEAICPALKNPGLVTGGSWVDLNGDERSDLILTMEWAPITFFISREGGFSKHTLADTEGWWNTVIPADFDLDGDMDFIATNLGLNSLFQASQEKPIRFYYTDLDNNGKKEQLITYYPEDTEILFADYADLTQQLPYIKKKYIYAKDFAEAPLPEVFGSNKWMQENVRKSVLFEHSYFENLGTDSLSFQRTPLPQSLQYAPILAGVASDLDEDGFPDLLIGGNYYENNIHLSRYDASFGALALNRNGHFEEGDIQSLGVNGQIRSILQLPHPQFGHLYILGRNDANLRVLTITKSRKPIQ